mgnify:CR=1 FL=1
MKYIITINSRNYEVEVEKGEARLLSVSEAAAAPVAIAPSPPPAVPVPAGPVDTAPAPAAGDEAIKAPIPGIILSIQKRVGDRVKAGDVVVILEAMKMENEVVAMRDGTVTYILVSKGAAVSTGDPLLTIR